MPIPGYLCGSISIHAPRMGSDDVIVIAAHGIFVFQSTPPHGERLPRMASPLVLPHFNPRSRMGSDERPAWCIHRACYFNPRSRMGSDNSHHPRRCLPSNFNPRSRMGSDWTPSNTKHLNKSFQSTLPHGERPVPVNRHAAAGTFQSTLPHGERLCNTALLSIHNQNFNPRSRMGSDRHQRRCR